GQGGYGRQPADAYGQQRPAPQGDLFAPQPNTQPGRDPFATQHASDPFAAQPPHATGPFAAQRPADPYGQGGYGQQPDPFAQQQDPFGQQDPFAQQDPFGQRGQQPPQHYTGHQTGQQMAAQPAPGPSAPGLGTPMHGIPGAGRRSRDQGHPQQQPPQAPNPVDSLLALATPQQQPEPGISRPYVSDEMFVTGERLRPEQQYDDRNW
ncbi:MAG: hypothetical protein HOV86_18245, partial [Thermoactinospora sp.]|nr:hypothetical protein [Thermoactinospora sp.]